jgi:hypothetical protein
MKSFCSSALVSMSCIFLGSLATAPPGAAAEPSPKEARVTRIIRDVKLLPSKAAPKPAALDDKVSDGTGVRTGDSSRSELTFLDLTITRLGENTIFTFDKAGRNVQLSSGSVLLRVPKDSGGARMTTGAVTVAITGTTAILESARAGRNKLIVLEGGARVSLNKQPRESATVRGSQMLDVPAGATKLPPVVNVDLNQIMKKHPLITDFRPLPSRDLIYATKPPPAQPAGGGPNVIPIIGSLIGAGLGVPINIGSGGTRTHGGGHKKSGAEGTKTSGQHTHDEKETTGSSHHAKPKAKPTPPKHRHPHKHGKGR